jgi:exodeoxyribonuclease VII large subunit
MTEKVSDPFFSERRILTVGQLTGIVRELLGETFGDVWVAGEISGVRLASSGHYYFTLKDSSAQLRAVAFRNAARTLRFKPQDGMAVLARGRIDVYEARGEYQLIVEAIEPQGLGALQLAFDQLKKKLAEEGLFDQARKRALPRLPQRIGVVTSPTGAVIRDILHVLGRRFPGLHIRLYPALVQGEGSVNEVVRGIRYFSESGWADVVIVARGGGSLEDLWTFNEEAVARAIAACAVPVISAIGHETDFTIADFVADLRAPTPSAAAEVVICTRQELLDRIQASLGRMHQSLRLRLAEARRRLQTVTTRIMRRDVRLRLARAWQRIDASGARMAELMRARLARERGRVDLANAHLTQLSPLKILDRGYAIVQTGAGLILKDPADSPPGTALVIRLARGLIRGQAT